MYTYIIFDSRHYKIGKTKDLKLRLESMKTSNPYIKLLLFLEKDIEKELHVKFKSKNVTGEWFDLSFEDLNYLSTIMNKNQDITISTKPVRKEILFKDQESIKIKRVQNMKILNKDRTDKTKMEIAFFIDNWNYKEFGKITQSKLIKVSKKNKKTIEKYYPKFKEKIIQINLYNSK